jgi:hypothetical protein
MTAEHLLLLLRQCCYQDQQPVPQFRQSHC